MARARGNLEEHGAHVGLLVESMELTSHRVAGPIT